MEFLGGFVTDLAATEAAGSVVVGHRLGLYRALAQGPATAEQLAERTGCDQRYLTEWLSGQAAGGYAVYDSTTGELSLTEEQAFCLTDPNGPNVPGAFIAALGMLRSRTADHRGVPHRRRGGLARARRRRLRRVRAFYRPGYVAVLVPNWIPALDGVESKLTAGGRVADVGCGLGSSSVLMAQAYPPARHG